jgi:photosystem II stability/assembly factor-like uncharacterized protein
MVKLKQIFSSIIFYLSILTFIIGFQFSDTMVNGWYQQFMPILGGRTITDITFTDSLNGYAITNEVSDTSFILRTTNAGDNWLLSHFDTGVCTYYNIQFINQSTGFVSGYIYNGSIFRIAKTTNGGINWFYINAPFDIIAFDMSVLNEDTIWIVDAGSLTGGVYRTTNGGGSWDRQLNLGNQNPNHIYMFNGRLGFICKDNVYLRRTTNSGLNWDTVSGAGGFLDMSFADSLTGWKTSMQKTTDGGLNWINQTLPQGGNILISQIVRFDNIKKDTIWGVGSTIMTGAGNRGMILRTINGGNNWLFQVPDSNINIFQYQQIKFTDPLIGWAYTGSSGVHTRTGGDPIFYNGIKQISSNIPEGFKFEQNYPNPFNPVTSFKLRIKDLSNVEVNVYDVSGRLITTLINKQMQAGEYLITFDGTNYSSGVYFYSLYADGILKDTKKMVLIK